LFLVPFQKSKFGKISGMSAVNQMRKEVKKYIDTADEKVVKMVYAMLEADADADWWASMPDSVKADVEEAIRQADKGNTLTHDEVKKKYPQWFTK
jgi:3-keto-L-gulonate-6-phosphate decarboxylase